MKHLAKQSGSSTVGLIAATGLYVGLLVYVTQYAFIPNTVNDGVASNDQRSGISPNVSPRQNGNLESVALSSSDKLANRDNPGQDVLAQQDLKSSITDDSTNATQDRHSEIEAISNQKTGLVQNQIDREISFTKSNQNKKNQFNQNSMPGPGINPYIDTSDRISAESQYHATQNMMHRNNQYGNGYASSSMNNSGSGQGEFNFSMRFKSRAKMDANSDWDSRFNADNHLNQSVYAQQDAGAYPFYQAYYQKNY